MAIEPTPIIIIRKRKKAAHHGSHGGSWKIAYADFVTAMMAFFLLMWLINIINEEQKKGIADYFSMNYLNMQTRNGSNGMLAGKNVANENNSSGKSSEERSRSNDPAVDMEKSKQHEAFQKKADLTLEKDKLPSDKKTEKTNEEKVRRTDSASESGAPKSGIEIQKNSRNNESPIIVEKNIHTKKQEVAANVTAEEQKDKEKAANKDPHSKAQKKSDSMQTNADKQNQEKEQAAAKNKDKNKSKELQKEIIAKDIQNIIDHAIEQKRIEQNAQDKILKEKVLTDILKQIKDNKLNKNYAQTIEQAVSEKIKQAQKELKKTSESSTEKKELLKQLQKEEQERLNKVSSSIMELVQKNSELKGLMSNIVVENRPEGLRIQLVDRDKHSMFASGSSSMTPKTRDLLRIVSDLIKPIPNGIVISGHTDAHPFVSNRQYGNWELSADRANETRRVLSQDYEIDPTRFESVMGKEATDPFNKEDPFDPSNRRISITLLRQYGKIDDAVLNAANARPEPTNNN